MVMAVTHKDDCFLNLNEPNRSKENGTRLIWISKLPENRLVI